MNRRPKIERVAMAIEDAAATGDVETMEAQRDHAHARLKMANDKGGSLARAWCNVMHAWDCRITAVIARMSGDIQTATMWERYSESRLRSARGTR